MKVVKSNIKKILNYYEQAQLYETDFLGFGFHEHNSVMEGKDGCNALYCWIHKLPIFNVPSSQGTIVANKGDFSFIRIARTDPRNPETFLNKWKNFLFKKTRAIGCYQGGKGLANGGQEILRLRWVSFT